MNLTKEKIYGYIGSLIFCTILFLILWFSALKTIIPTKELGILVNFGNVDEASGMFEPGNMGDNSDNISIETTIPEISEQATTPTPQPIITQNTEQTAFIEAENKKKEEQKRKQEEQKRKQEEEKRKQEEQKRQQAVINNQVAGAFGIGNTQSTGQGTGTGQGNQGSPQGNSDHGANTGVGGYGNFSLAGRSLVGSLPRPVYSVQEEGLIVVDITVGRNGNVISALIGKGTTISNATMRQSALEAAKKAKFDTISGNQNQSGKITYRYYLK
ncbi:MAG: energy transducer TonB [Candidatus Azobacteroides sp.]|nr:energy transducer TonB [Candidatus Azobacteroides sp.]